MTLEQTAISLIVAVMRKHVCEANVFLDTTFGAAAYSTLTQLTTFVTGDSSADAEWWKQPAVYIESAVRAQ